MEKSNTPFKSLGEALRKIRTRLQESLDEVSGAVEIDSEKLIQFERGNKRPSEDILELLISHFSVKDEEATELWMMAGYGDPKLDAQDEPQLISQPVMLLPFDARIIYTDSMNVVINNTGVVINFMQNTGTPGNQLPAARVGMSLEQAQKVVKTLSETIKTSIEHNKPKNLPASNDQQDKKR